MQGGTCWLDTQYKHESSVTSDAFKSSSKVHYRDSVTNGQMDNITSTRVSSADITVLKKLLLLSAAMFVFPLSTFFVLQNILPKENVLLPVIASVIAVHIVIGVYVWMALNENDNEEPLKED